MVSVNGDFDLVNGIGAFPIGARVTEVSTGEVRLRLVQQGQSIQVNSQSCKVPALGREILTFNRTLPSEPGRYTIAAELTDASGKVIRSLRDFSIPARR